MVQAETKVHINPGRVRSGDEHIVTVSSGIHGGLCLTFNSASVADLRQVDDGNGVGWLIDADSADALIAAMQEHMA